MASVSMGLYTMHLFPYHITCNITIMRASTIVDLTEAPGLQDGNERPGRQVPDLMPPSASGRDASTYDDQSANTDPASSQDLFISSRTDFSLAGATRDVQGRTRGRLPPLV